MIWLKSVGTLWLSTVDKMVKIATHDVQNLKDFFDQYFIWVDHQNFYHKPHKPKIEIADHGWPCIPFHDVESINTCESPVIVIDCTLEGIRQKQRCFDFYRYDRKYLIISNGSWNQTHYHHHFKYQTVNYPFFLFYMVNSYLSPYSFHFYSDKIYDFTYPKPNVWISTIGVVRPTRSHLVQKLKSSLSYSNFILRYSGQDLGKVCDGDFFKFDLGKFDPYTWLYGKYQYNLSQSIPIKMYNQCYFNLVVETDIENQEEFHLTEKTVKCLISGIPFVIVSTPKFLEHLHALGFQTFHTVWDETYDQITDHADRISAIVALCENLRHFDWQLHRQKLMEITQQNRDRLFNLHDISTQVFQQLEKAVLSLDQ